MSKNKISTIDKMVQVRYTCPACKGTGYVKAKGIWTDSERLYDRVCCNSCDNGCIYEWVSFKSLMESIVRSSLLPHSLVGVTESSFKIRLPETDAEAQRCANSTIV